MSKFPLTWQVEAHSTAPLVQFICELVASPSIELSEAAGKLFYEMSTRIGPDTIVSLLSAAAPHAGDSTVALRYGAVICSVAGSEDCQFLNCLQTGAIDFVIRLCRTPDELVQVM